MRKWPVWLRPAVIVLLGVNALDVSTSLIPSPADHLVAVPPRSALAWLVQLVLLVPLAVWLARHAPAGLAAYRSLPIPRLPRLVLTAFFAVACAHVALRLERYPWSPVAMFSSAVPEVSSNTYSRMGYLVLRGRELEAVSFLREGSPWFARYGMGFDYKAGWAMHLYAPTHRSARDVFYETVRSQGLPEPLHIRVRYARASGRLLQRLRPR